MHVGNFTAEGLAEFIVNHDQDQEQISFVAIPEIFNGMPALQIPEKILLNLICQKARFGIDDQVRIKNDLIAQHIKPEWAIESLATLANNGLIKIDSCMDGEWDLSLLWKPQDLDLGKLARDIDAIRESQKPPVKKRGFLGIFNRK